MIIDGFIHVCAGHTVNWKRMEEVTKKEMVNVGVPVCNLTPQVMTQHSVNIIAFKVAHIRFPFDLCISI